MMQHGEYRQEPEGKNASYSVSEENETIKLVDHSTSKIDILIVIVWLTMSILIRSVILIPVEISFRTKNF